jgi:hypothetical protein
MKRLEFGKLSVAFLALIIGSTSLRAADKNIVDMAASNGNFTMLVAALKAAGLVNTLQGPCLFTVFAPTDAAFSKLPAGTSANLLSPTNKAQLIQILLLSRGAGQGELTSADEAKGSQGVSRQILPVKLNGGPVSVMAPKSPLRTSQHATASFTSSTP